LPGDDKELAGNEQMLLHVDLAGPRSAPFSEDTLSKLQAIVAEQADLPLPDYIGRVIALPSKK
jgi:acyl-CoA thioester hydrolase